MAKLNIIAMRLGPGPHLKGLELMGGIVKPEEVRPFSGRYTTKEAKFDTYSLFNSSITSTNLSWDRKSQGLMLEDTLMD